MFLLFNFQNKVKPFMKLPDWRKNPVYYKSDCLFAWCLFLVWIKLTSVVIVT